MQKIKNISLLMLFKIAFQLVCGLTQVANNKSSLKKLKFAIGILIIGLNSEIAFSQRDTSINKKYVYSKNDTVRLNIILKEQEVKIEEIVVTCYYGGMPKHKEPYFIGGDKALKTFIDKKMEYPKEAIKKGIEGNVEISYVVDKNGNIKNVQLVKGIGYGCDEEAIRIVKLFPKYSIGIIDEKATEFQKTIFIEFMIKKANRN